jgi:L-lactate dehydrogenase complex protein LldG
MDESRERVLGALRAAAPRDIPLPELADLGLALEDPRRTFVDAVAVVGGTLVPVAPGALAGEVRALAEKLSARLVCVLAEGAGEGNVRLESLTDPHQMEGIDLAVIPGVFGVAENGAIWVDTRGWAHRGVFVVAQHLAIVLPAAEIVPDLHAAYERIRPDGPGFRLFIAGPSKTADIEQSLVIGAHGPRSCTVFLVG